MHRWRLLDDDRVRGYALAEERVDGAGGRVLRFSSAILTPTESAFAGQVALGPALEWGALEIDVDGVVTNHRLDDGVELAIDDVPALHGVTARRLRAAGLRPSQGRGVEVLALAAGGGAPRRLAATYTWLGRQEWRYEEGLNAAWLEIRPDGLVRVVEGAAELEG